jgi:hypothetical protein
MSFEAVGCVDPLFMSYSMMQYAKVPLFQAFETKARATKTIDRA